MKIYFISFENDILNDNEITIICYIIVIYENIITIEKCVDNEKKKKRNENYCAILNNEIINVNNFFYVSTR